MKTRKSSMLNDFGNNLFRHFHTKKILKDCGMRPIHRVNHTALTNDWCHMGVIA